MVLALMSSLFILTWIGTRKEKNPEVKISVDQSWGSGGLHPSIMCFYCLSPNTKASQTVDYALNTGLVLFFSRI